MGISRCVVVVVVVVVDVTPNNHEKFDFYMFNVLV